MVKIYLLIAILFLFVRCTTQNNELKISENSEIYHLATPCVLAIDKTTINLEDYFNDVSLIDSVCIDKSMIVELSENKKEANIKSLNEQAIPFISELKIWIKNISYSIVLKKSKKIRIKIAYNSNRKNCSEVCLAGDFNNWNPKSTLMINSNGSWTTELLLNPGRYCYQIVADGKWFLDPANKDSCENGMGGYNSILIAGNTNNENIPFLTTKTSEDSKIKIAINKPVDNVVALWENYSLTNDFIKISGTEITLIIPANARKTERSYLRCWAYNKDGVSNDLLILLKNGKPVLNSNDITRSEIESQIIYFMLVDRFNNGNKKNDEPIKDAEVSPKANYMGGDLAGITKKIQDGYFSSLGVNTIWITPIHQNPLTAYKENPKPYRKYSGYHGYWPIAITKIDHRFGTKDEFKTMINDAHNNNMNVLLDYVANHLHEESPLFKAHPDWATQLNLPDGRKNIRLWDEYRLTTWFDTYLPTLDLSRPEVYEPITDSVLYWVNTYKFDGFRHDATKHVPEIFWRTLTKKLKKQILIPEKKSFYQIGETYGSRELISSYVNSGELDGQFDFNLYFDARNIFAKDNESFEKLKNSLTESLEYYGYHNLMGNITGNHDQSRFISIAGGDLASNEDDKEAGWKRDVGVGNSVGYKKLSMLTAFIMTIPGIPIIYYGDEFGMPGANDPDNRRMMKFDNLNKYEKETKIIAEKLIKLRKNKLSLIYGDIKILQTTDKIFVYARKYFKEITIIAMNKDSATKDILIELPTEFISTKFTTHFNSKINISSNKLSIKLNGNSFEVLTNN